MHICELLEMLDKIHEKIDSEIISANESSDEEVEMILNKYNLLRENICDEFNSFTIYKLNSYRILIVGEVNLKRKFVEGICKRLGIDSNCIDYVTYDEAVNYDFVKLRYSNKYSDVIFGASPHSCRGKCDGTSIITMMEKKPDEYPNVIRALSTNELKITKTSLKIALKKTIKYSKYSKSKLKSKRQNILNI